MEVKIKFVDPHVDRSCYRHTVQPGHPIPRQGETYQVPESADMEYRTFKVTSVIWSGLDEVEVCVESFTAPLA